MRIERAAMSDFRQGLKALNLEDSPDPTQPLSRQRSRAAG